MYRSHHRQPDYRRENNDFLYSQQWRNCVGKVERQTRNATAMSQSRSNVACNETMAVSMTHGQRDRAATTALGGERQFLMKNEKKQKQTFEEGRRKEGKEQKQQEKTTQQHHHRQQHPKLKSENRSSTKIFPFLSKFNNFSKSHAVVESTNNPKCLKETSKEAKIVAKQNTSHVKGHSKRKVSQKKL